MATPSVSKAALSDRLENIGLLFKSIKHMSHDLSQALDGNAEYQIVALVAMAEKGHAQAYKLVDDVKREAKEAAHV
jgi:hypothetical protein